MKHFLFFILLLCAFFANIAIAVWLESTVALIVGLMIIFAVVIAAAIWVP